MLPAPAGLWAMPKEMLEQIPGYGPDIEKNREEARKLMQKAGYGPDKRLSIKIATRNIPIYRDPAIILIDQIKSIYVDAELDVRRNGDSLTGTLVASAKAVTLDPRSPIAFDGDAKIVARADQLLANIDVTTAKAGSAKLALDVDAPRDVSDMRAWRTLGRDSIRWLSVSKRRRTGIIWCCRRNRWI